MYREKIGIIGGFGAYASLSFYEKLIEAFHTEYDRNYPHIIMDNNFTMPSRTRALLYDEAYEEIVEEIAKSMKRMIEYNVERIILVCGTAHCFLEEVYRLVPEAEERVVDIVNLLGEELREQKVNSALVVAAEGTLLKRLYPQKLERYGIKCLNPGQEYFEELRYFIECVKRNTINKETAERFLVFLKQFDERNVILGCTEFPILVQYISELKLENDLKEKWSCYHFFDPLEIVIAWLKKVMV